MCVCQHDKFEEELSILPCLDMASAVRTLPHEFQSMMYWAKQTRVLYMSFDKFLLAVEPRDISQADKSIIRVSSFPKLSDG